MPRIFVSGFIAIVATLVISGCVFVFSSTDYNITLLGSDGHVYYMTYYMAWNIPYIGQSMHIRYMTTHIWPFKNSVVAAY